ncbi:hypothetical protein SOCEGT47_026110 [Sorangium cellulosum]|uniref:Uncharacterized protein n=1 Tax=Sorangium cellulosum TaxID=56 RepID=A0A4P2PZ65_SORCE|nr:hypothetical protein [Sorangium cellulosum]AUX22110.1 hypothetical protein SOCEGT47_026110 [Sorangium cellulosum]
MGEPSVQPVDAPPVQLIEVRATTGLDDDYRPVRTALDPGGSTQVLSTASFVLKFDRFLLPGAVGPKLGPESLCVSGDLATPVRKYADCVNPVPLAPTYNPVRREVTFRQTDGAPRLAPGTRYALTVLGPADESAPSGIRAFDGAPLRENVRIEFTVAAAPPQAMPERQPTGDFYCYRDPECVATMCATDPVCAQCSIGGVAIFLTACSGCHNGTNAAAGLDLNLGAPQFNEVENLLATAIGHAAHQTQTGERAHVGEESPDRFGTAMPLIDPGNPGNSYLLYKILIGQNAVDPTLSPDQAEQLRDEVDRLRAGFVMGMPMPPTGASFKLFASDPADPSLVPHVDGMDILTAWILNGAEPRDCSAAPPAP